MNEVDKTCMLGYIPTFTFWDWRKALENLSQNCRQHNKLGSRFSFWNKRN